MTYHYQHGVIKEKSKIIPILIALLLSVGLAFSTYITTRAEVNAVTPSTNAINMTKTPKKWAHVNQLSQGTQTTELQFVSERAFWSCFEYRSDNEPNTVTGANPNPAVTDGRWTQVCVRNSQTTRTIQAEEYVEVRMVYGAEEDERFDWTRFDVIPATYPSTKDECKKDGWKDFTGVDFINQGDCVSWVASSEKSAKHR